VPVNAPTFNKPVETLPKEVKSEPAVVLSSSATKDKTLSVVNAQPFVPKLKIPAPVSSSSDSAKDMSSAKASAEIPKVKLNPESVAFVPKQIVEPVVNPVPAPAPTPAPVSQVAAPIGGFGNK